MISRIARQVALRYLIANDESTAVDISDAVRSALAEELTRFPMDWDWDNKESSTIKGAKLGQFSFSARPVAWDTAEVRDERGVGRLAGGLLFVGSYDRQLKSKSPTGPKRKEWTDRGGDDSLKGLIVPFELQVGYYRKKLGHGMSPDYSITLSGGLVEITDQFENMDVVIDNVSADASGIADLIQSCMDSPPEGSMEYIKVPVRQRLKK